MKYRPVDPLRNRSKSNPTGSDKIIADFEREITLRYRGIVSDLGGIFSRVDFASLSADQLQQIIDAAGRAIDRRLALEQRYTQFWAGEYDSQAAAMGAAQTQANLSRLIVSYAAARPIESIIYSDAYINREAIAKLASYEHFTELGALARGDLADILAESQGMGVRDVTAKIMQRMEVSASKAKLYAQTSVPGTLREARVAEMQHAEEQFGIKLGLLWTSTLMPTTRENHASRHGRVYTAEQVRDFYAQDGNRFNCYLPGTKVSGRFIAGSKGWYAGEVLKVVTASGKTLTVTPNHPLLSNHGLVSAASIRKGDNLFTYCEQVEVASRISALDSELIYPLIEDVFCSLSDFGESLSVRVGAVDFHGDARRMDKNINVVRANRHLPFAINAGKSKLLDDLALELANTNKSSVLRSLQSFVQAVRSSACGFVRFLGDKASFFFGAACKPVVLCFTRPSCFKSICIKEATNCFSGHAKFFTYCKDRLSIKMRRVNIRSAKFFGLAERMLSPVSRLMKRVGKRSVCASNGNGDLFNGFTGNVSCDKVIDIVVFHYEGHVYDLQEESGLMYANGIIASNCHCSITETLLDDNGKPILTDKLTSAMRQERKAWDSV